MLELAIFGTLFLTMLGFIINYGLNFDYSQQGLMNSFREGLRLTTPDHVRGNTYFLLRDRHLPNPSHPFAMGTVIPVSASTTITRSFKTQELPSAFWELPATTMRIQNQILRFTTADFRTEFGAPETSKERYAEIYGSSNVCWKTKCGAVDLGRGRFNIRILDNCEGEIISYEACARQAREIVDPLVCELECERGRLKEEAGTTGCRDICAKPLAHIPWYAEGAELIDPVSHQYRFPKLESLFALARVERMGLQQDYQKVRRTDNTLVKQETRSAVTSTDTINWREDTTRELVTRATGDTSGTPVRREITTSACQGDDNCNAVTRTWVSNW